jgi:hypothetical protein
MNATIRRLLWVIVPLFLLCAVGSTPAQQCPLSLSVSYAPVQSLAWSDVDFDHFQSTALIFTIHITNSSATQDTGKLQITLAVRLADGSGDFEPAIEYASKPFTIPPGGRTITNLQIGGSSPDPQHLQQESFYFRDEARSRLRDVTLGGGVLPAGSYTFWFTLANQACGTIPGNPSGFTLELVNPSRVELRSPTDGEITTEFPFFEFYQDGKVAVLTVAEKSSDQTREDAITRTPPMLQVELTGQNSFLYSGGRPLEQGKTYVWNVVSKSLGGGGQEVDVNSPVGLFTVGNSAESITDDDLLRQLEELLGSRYPSVFQEIHGDNFKLTASYLLNGTQLSKQDLLILLYNLRKIADSIELSFE